MKTSLRSKEIERDVLYTWWHVGNLSVVFHKAAVYACVEKYDSSISWDYVDPSRRCWCAIFRGLQVHSALLGLRYVQLHARSSCTCPAECRNRDDVVVQNRGKQKVAWESVRATDRSLYIRGYSDSKEVSFYPYLEPAYRPVSLSSISYLSRYPAFFSVGSFRWHVICRLSATVASALRNEHSPDAWYTDCTHDITSLVAMYILNVKYFLRVTFTIEKAA